MFVQVYVLLMYIGVVLWGRSFEPHIEAGGTARWEVGGPGDHLCCSCCGAAQPTELWRRARPLGRAQLGGATLGVSHYTKAACSLHTITIFHISSTFVYVARVHLHVRSAYPLHSSGSRAGSLLCLDLKCSC